MIKIFTLKFADRSESFDDSILENFLANKEVVKWDGHFFQRKNDFYWTVAVEYQQLSPAAAAPSNKAGDKANEEYKKILSENDWPLFKRLREWRNETGKKQGVPPYIIFTNMQLAKIAVTRPDSLNMLQQIEGIGSAKREKYGSEVLQLIKSFGLPVTTPREEKQDG
jgi:superfamily II DNA helicase RecQ